MSGLKSVKVGDTIKVVVGHFGSSYVLHKVERLTATQAVCENASFKIDSGLQIGTRSSGGNRWSTFTRYGQLVSEAQIAELIAESAMKNRIRAAAGAIDRIKVSAANIEAAEAFIAASSDPKAQP